MSDSGSSFAQSGDPKAEAEAALSAFWAARDARDWDAAAAFIHPDIVSAIYDRALFKARGIARWEERRTEDIQRTYPVDMPPEVVAWFEKQRESGAESRRDVVFPGPPPLSEIEGLSPLQYVALELKMLDPRENPGARLEEDSFITDDVFNAAAFQEADRRVIGSVPADDSLVHVLYRMDRPSSFSDPLWAPTEPFALGTASMKRTPEGWRIWSGAADLIGSLGSGVAFMLAHGMDGEQAGEDMARRHREKKAGIAGEAFVRELFTAMDERRWRDAARLIDAPLLQRFRDEAVTTARQAMTPPASSEDWYPPNMPAEVRAWHEQQRAAHREAAAADPHDLTREYARIETLDELEALEPAELFARHLEATDLRTAFDREVERHGVAVPPDVSDRTARMLNPLRSVIGAMAESDSIVHVVYRVVRPYAPEVRVPGVATVRLRSDGWRLTHAPEDPAFLVSSGWIGYSPMGPLHVFFDDEDDFRSAAGVVAEWATPDGARARAFLTGYTGGIEPPEALTIEVTQPDGTIMKLDLPAAVFPKLMQLIAGWPPLDE